MLIDSDESRASSAARSPGQVAAAVTPDSAKVSRRSSGTPAKAPTAIDEDDDMKIDSPPTTEAASASAAVAEVPA